MSGGLAFECRQEGHWDHSVCSLGVLRDFWRLLQHDIVPFPVSFHADQFTGPDLLAPSPYLHDGYVGVAKVQEPVGVPQGS